MNQDNDLVKQMLYFHHFCNNWENKDESEIITVNEYSLHSTVTDSFHMLNKYLVPFSILFQLLNINFVYFCFSRINNSIRKKLPPNSN